MTDNISDNGPSSINTSIHRDLNSRDGEELKPKKDLLHTDTRIDNQAPILVLVNPHSGRGKSVKIFKKQVLNIFETNHTNHDIFVTTSDLRVRQYLSEKSHDELAKYKAIVVIAGDGLLFETVNAIMNRPDWQEIIKIPIGAIPTGSGNGLAYTLLNTSQLVAKTQSEAIKVCCEQVIRGEKKPCDLVKIEYGNETLWSFLSIGWGLLADIDIDSEWLRCLGEFRFTIYGILRSLTSVSYKGRLSFRLPPSDPTDEATTRLIEQLRSDSYLYRSISNPDDGKKQTDIDKEGEWVHIEDKFVCLYAVHQPYVNSVTRFSPKSAFTDQLTYLTYIRGGLNIYQIIEFLLAIEDGSHDKLPYVRVVPVQSFEFQPLQASKVVVDGEVIPWTVLDGPISATVEPGLLNLAWSADRCPIVDDK